MAFSNTDMLRGPVITLEPLEEAHREPLRAAAAEDQSIWDFFPRTFNGAGDDFDPWFDYSLQKKAVREHSPFAVRRQASGRIIGTTRYYDMSPEHLRLAIGSTWYAKEARGTLINSEVRLLTLSYAFEKLCLNRVEFITDPFNMSSRAAMKILGVVQEGVIRHHLIYKDGRVRDSLLFSIVREEWPEVRARLFDRLGYDALSLQF